MVDTLALPTFSTDLSSRWCYDSHIDPQAVAYVPLHHRTSSNRSVSNQYLIVWTECETCESFNPVCTPTHSMPINRLIDVLCIAWYCVMLFAGRMLAVCVV